MKISNFIIIALSVIFFTAFFAVAAEKMGGEILKIDGASKGVVTFPHKEHQDGLKDCKICHTAFPQELGVIKKKKDSNELKKKQVMNEICIKCHKDYKAQGKEYGPISCNGCHGN